MPTRNGAVFSELFEQAMDTFNGAIQAGAKFQEDVGKWWSGAMGPATGSAQDWQRRSQAMWAQAMPTAQRNVDEYLRLFDASYHMSIDLMKKAMTAGRADTITDAQVKSHRLLDDSMEALRDNAKAMAEANVKVFEAWADLVRNGAQSAAEAAHAAQEAAQEAAQAARRETVSSASKTGTKTAHHRKSGGS